MREEIHAAELIRVGKIEVYRKIHKSDRIAILREYARQIPAIFPNSRIISICIDKTTLPPGTDCMELAWKRLFERYNTFLRKNNNEKGIIVADDTNADKLRQLLRKMRVYNPVTSHFGGYYQANTENILEDIFMRASHHSYFVQTVDVCAHLLYRQEFPKGALHKFGVNDFYKLLRPILLTEASKSDPLGIVRK